MAPTLVEHVVADAGAFLKQAQLQVSPSGEDRWSVGRWWWSSGRGADAAERTESGLDPLSLKLVLAPDQ